MIRHAQGQPVERYFEFSLLGLLASGFLALATSQPLGWPLVLLTAAAILTRAAAVAGFIRFALSPAALAVIAFSSVAFYPLDCYFLSRDFVQATIHGFCFIAAIKIFTAQARRDRFYLASVALVELTGAAFLSMQPLFFVWLALFILFAVAAFASADISRGLRQAQQIAPTPNARIGWRLTALALFASVGIVVLAGMLFLVVPRTARAAARLFPPGSRVSGFASEVDLGNFGAIAQDKRPVMHVLSYRGALPQGLKWRGAALSRFDGRRWSELAAPAVRMASGTGAVQVAGELQRSRRDGPRLLYRVDLATSDTGVLFIAGIPEFINTSALRLLRSPDDAFRIPHATGEPVTYEVSAQASAPLPTALVARSRYLQLPPIDSRIWSLAAQWSGNNGSPYGRARRIEQRLHEDYTYTLDTGRTRVRDPLANFLFETRRGYCEYFASAMAVMLRTQGIPSRVVTGFLTGYYNDVSGQYVIRASDAHAWVEGWIEGRGWTTFDPTPAAPPLASGILGRIAVYLDAMDSAWQQWVVTYDVSRQADLAARLHHAVQTWRSPAQPARWRDAAVPVGSLIALAVLIAVAPRLRAQLRSRRAASKVSSGKASASDIALLYARMLKRLERKGYRKPAWFTPLEFAGTLPQPERGYALQITQLYNAARYGNDREAAARLPQLIRAGAELPPDAP